MAEYLSSDIFEFYNKTIFSPTFNISEFDPATQIPVFSEEIVNKLIEKTIQYLMQDDIVMELTGPIYVIGDVHGNIIDLMNILKNIGFPPDTKMLFLGDYVDRGEYSIPVITLLCSLKCAYPQHVFLIRGNHEELSVSSVYGFKQEVLQTYDDTMFMRFEHMFNYLPLAAIVDKTIFCVHGGISEYLSDISQIRKIQRPLNSNDFTPMIKDLLWSDPLNGITHYLPSNRGTGNYFGLNSTMEFLKTSQMKQIIRGHQCVAGGICKHWDGLLYTVFSSSNYNKNAENYAGLLHIDENSEIKAYIMTKIQRKVSQSPKAQARSMVNRGNHGKLLRRSSLFIIGQQPLPPIKPNKSFGSNLVLNE